MQPRHRTLIGSPQVLTLQLVWDQQVSGSEIMSSLRHVDEYLDINAMYDERNVSGAKRGGLAVVWICRAASRAACR